MSFPTTFDSLVNLPASRLVRGGGIDALIAAVNALETKAGVDSSAVTSTLDYLLKNAASVDPGHKHTTAGISGAIAIAKGGTNITGYTAGDILYCSATDVLAKLGIGASGAVLGSNGTIPGWVTNILKTDAIGTLTANSASTLLALNQQGAGSIATLALNGTIAFKFGKHATSTTGKLEWDSGGSVFRQVIGRNTDGASFIIYNSGTGLTLFSSVGTNESVGLASNGTQVLGVNYLGLISIATTITTPGTTGAQTINKPTGRVNIAAGGTSVVVTNSCVSANSIVIAVAATNDTTAQITKVVPTAGSFTIYTTAVTAETAFSFLVIN